MKSVRMTATPRRWIELDVLAQAMGLRPEQVRRRSAEGKLPRPSFHLGYTRPVWNRALLAAALPQWAAQRLEEAEVQMKEADKKRRPREGAAVARTPLVWNKLRGEPGIEDAAFPLEICKRW